MTTNISALPATGNATDRASGIQTLFMTQKTETVHAGEALVWQGDPAEDVFELADGAMRICRILPDGRRAILRFVFAGEVFGLTEGEEFSFTAEAITNVAVRRMRRSRFEAAIDGDTALRREHVGLICQELTAAQEQMVLLGRKSAEERVASFLVAMMRRAGLGDRSGAAFDLPMTRLDMADYLGLTIETVSRIMSKLSRSGVIAAQGRHQIRGRNAAGLLAIAADDSAPRALERRAA